MLTPVTYLIITIWVAGLGNAPQTRVLTAPGYVACKAKAAEINAAKIEDPRIVGVDARCVYVPVKQAS